MSFPKGAGLLALLVFLSPPARASEVTTQDLQVVGRALAFAEGARQSNTSIVVIYDGTDARSVREMQSILARVGHGLQAGDRVLSAVAVEQRQLSHARQGDAVFATAGVDQGLLEAYLRGSGMPCFTLEIAQVRDGACAVAIRSVPSVNIVFNSRNASAAGVSFATAFIMMVREL